MLKKDVLEQAKHALSEKVNVGGAAINQLDLKKIQETLINRMKLHGSTT